MVERRTAASRRVRDAGAAPATTGTRAPRYHFAGVRPADATVAVRAGARISVGVLAGHALALAAQLPRGGEVINLCEDRYLFTVAYAAALYRGAATLLPSGRNETAVREIRAAHPQAVSVGDRQDAMVELAVGEPPRTGAQPGALAIPASQRAAVLHTSGSTGTPTPHDKRWGALVHGARIAAERFRPAPGTTFVATVPPQHMYGLEVSVMLALQAGGVLAAGQPMFPADVRHALETAPGPRVLVTTPVHLRAILESGAAIPALDWVLSSTAPLDAELAAGAESRFGAPVHEIYGSTETGAMASRRPAEEQLWRPMPGFRFEWAEGYWWASAPHLDGPVALGDLLKQAEDGRFALVGRQAELVKIAGKRIALGELNRRLLAVDGVLDGTFYAAGDAAAGTVRRLVAFVVAPDRSEREILDALRRELDPVFLPRPLVRVDALPRNEAGKLPRRALEALAARLL